MRGQGVDSRTPVGTLRPIGDRLQGKPCGGLLSCRCPPAVALHELEAGGEPREAAHRDLRRPAEALVGNDRGIRSVLGAALGLLPRVIAVLAQTDPAQLARCKRQQALERPIGDSASPGCRRSHLEPAGKPAADLTHVSLLRFHVGSLAAALSVVRGKRSGHADECRGARRACCVTTEVGQEADRLPGQPLSIGSIHRAAHH